MNGFIWHTFIFVVVTIGTMANIINTAESFWTDSPWLLLHIPCVFIGGYYIWVHFWWTWFFILFDPCWNVWKHDESPRFLFLQKAKKAYEDRDLAQAFHFLKQAEQAALTHYTNR